MKGLLILLTIGLIGKISCASTYNNECKTEELGKNIPYPGNCSKYITCIGGGVETDCPGRLHFNKEKEICDWPERAGCDTKYVGDKDKLHPACVGVELGKNVPYLGSCEKYISCIDDGVEVICPETLHFNAEKEVRDWPERSGCDSKYEESKNEDNSGENHTDNNAEVELHPASVGGELGKNVPYPGICARFISCIDSGVERSCPHTLHFNAEKEVCDRPEKAGCNYILENDKNNSNDNSGENDDKHKHSEDKLHPECKGAELGKNVPYPGNCDMFITCIGGGKERICPDSLHFNAEKQVCDWPERAACISKSEGEGTTDNGIDNSGDSSESKLHPECKGIELGKNVPYPKNCEKFITCIGGGVERICPEPLHFNAEKQVCDWPERAECNSKSEGEGTTDNGIDNSGDSSESKLHPECKGIELGKNVPYPKNCEKFITCIGGGVERICPEPLHFNAEKQVCDWPERAECNSKSEGEGTTDNGIDNSGDSSDSESKLHPECKGIELGKNVPYPKNCEKFITCIGGGVERICPESLHFNAEKEVCDWPERAKCDSTNFGSRFLIPFKLLNYYLNY